MNNILQVCKAASAFSVKERRVRVHLFSGMNPRRGQKQPPPSVFFKGRHRNGRGIRPDTRAGNTSITKLRYISPESTGSGFPYRRRNGLSPPFPATRWWVPDVRPPPDDRTPSEPYIAAVHRPCHPRLIYRGSLRAGARRRETRRNRQEFIHAASTSHRKGRRHEFRPVLCCCRDESLRADCLEIESPVNM